MSRLFLSTEETGSVSEDFFPLGVAAVFCAVLGVALGVAALTCAVLEDTAEPDFALGFLVGRGSLLLVASDSSLLLEEDEEEEDEESEEEGEEE